MVPRHRGGNGIAPLNEQDAFLGCRRELEIVELGKSHALDASVALLLRVVQRWCAVNGPKDDVSILGIEVRRPS